ncbi:hyaluronan-binding protein 2-like [Megalops cyprinoides]|uniref:hyaluronan-binding protein 2-like n=1 Tax=Megalops cyprinoides TaxID=118141 RepID=UPI001863B2DB|nr:hyaluronan-binding protein 2-like [Megalops cyprinoides]
MVTKLVLLLVLSALIVPAQSGRGGGHHHHGHGPGKKPGKNDKHDRTDSGSDVHNLEMTDEGSEEDDGDWLFDLQETKKTCDPNPCLNNGVCEIKKDKFECDCPKPFKGKRCQKAHKVCKRAKCGRGECVLTSKPPYYECKCKEPFQPPHCQTVSMCQPNPCKNGGSCKSKDTEFKCDCPDGFSGKFCQVGPDDCYEGNGESYRGLVSETEDGDDCLYWNSYFILEKGTDPFSSYEDDDGLGPHNHCRNPDGDTRPWCFIRRRNKLRWDHCNVKKCPEPSVLPTAETTEAPTAPVQPAEPTPGPPEPTPKPAEPTPKPAEPTAASMHGEQTTATIKPAQTTASPVVREFSTCGQPQPSRASQRIYGGLKAIPGSHPWQASLQVRPIGTQLPFQHVCGGALIKPCWILTAGHCVRDKQKQMRVVLGGVDLGKHESFDQIVEVESVIIHEKYKETPEAIVNDIALMKLKAVDGRCANETKFVKTVCLADSPFPDGTECTISGWGATETSEYGSSQLLDANVLLISQERCSSSKVYGTAVDDSMLCAGYLQGGVDSCQGDSGGPLTCQRDDVHYVYGLVSWGDSCGKENKPGVYTRVTKFTDWINSKIQAA